MATGMKEVSTPSLIDVAQLRIGMFVHLDGGWMSHPFPLSSFKIGSVAQIATIRSLGKQRVRWSPEKSDVDACPGTTASTVSASAAAVVAPAAAPTLVETPEAASRRQRREALLAQRASLQLCEHQFAEATKACKHATELVTTKPQEARANKPKPWPRLLSTR